MIKTLLIFSCLAVLACSTPAKNSFDAGVGFKGRFVSSESVSDHLIPFPSGSIHPVGFFVSSEDRRNFRNTSQIKAKDRGIMTDEDCFSGDSGGPHIYCMILEAERILNPLHRDNPLKKLTPEEYASLVWFTEFGYQIYNKSLWTQDPSDLTKNETGIKLALSGLNRLPGENRQVVRCDLADENGSLSEEQIRSVANRYEKNKTFRIKGFWSTSIGTDPDYVEQWIQPCHVELKIHLNGSGVLIQEISTRPQEQEILVRPLTQFSVVAKKESKKNGKSFVEIELTETN
jgi:hypothetical protein